MDIWLKKDGKLLYQLGSVYKFTPNIATFFNHAESFRPQNNRTLIINGELPAEQGKSFETGLKYEECIFKCNCSFI